MNDRTEPYRLTDNELLGWLVVEAYRRIQEREGVRLLLHPWPPCPVCGVHATTRTVSASSATFDTTMVLEPCGHALVAADATIAGLWETAEIHARHIVNVEAATGQATDRPDPLTLLLDQFTANAVQASRAVRADRSDETRAAHQAIAAVWTQAAHLLSQAIKQTGGGLLPDATSEAATIRHPWIKGHCPACRRESLFVANGGYITCARLECPDPEAASNLLERRTATPVVASDARRRRALARNAVGPALNARGHRLPLSVRVAVADAVLAAADGDPGTTPTEEGVADRRYWTTRYDREGS